MTGGFHLMRLAGVDVYLDWSLAIIFFLITMSLASGLFPAWHPDWSTALSWFTAAAAAILFLGSVLVHEMSHALVGRARGMSIRRITLFIFGGMAHLDEEARDWRTELYMAVAGPVTSLAIGFICIWLSSFGVGDVAGGMQDPEELLAGLGPWTTLLLWLGPVNLVLGVFNLVPGFPLDGGRVMRATIWGATGDLHKATRLASNAGRAFAWILIACGVAMILGIRVPIFGTGLVGGLWLALIGWFLHNAAIMSYRQLLVQSALEDVPVSRLMLTDVRSVPGTTTLQAFVDDYILGHEQRAWPVTDNGKRLSGIVGLADTRRVPRERWAEATVADIMRPAGETISVAPSDETASALRLIGQHNVNQLPVIENDELKGLLRREDILRWLALHSDESLSGRRRETHSVQPR